MDKFLLAQNPMRPEQAGIWINHMLNPRAIIRCSEGHIKPPEEIYQQFQFRNKQGNLEEWTLSVYQIFTSDISITAAEQVKPVFERAWRWFRSYREWQENNFKN